METKINLGLSASNTLDDLKIAICNSLVVEYVIDLLQKTIKENSKDFDVMSTLDNFREIIDRNDEVAFDSVKLWLDNKVNVLKDLLTLVTVFDADLARHEKIESGAIINSVQSQITDFTLSLSLIEFNEKFMDLGKLKLKPAYIDNTLEQLRLVDENQILSTISDMQLSFVPLEIEKYRNTFIEEKLNRVAHLVNATNSALDADFEKFVKQVNKIHKKFRDISYERLTDGEKFDKSRRLIKQVNPHRQLLDKLEDGLTEANELKRQLHIHEGRLERSLVEELAGYDKRIEENPEDAEMYEREKDSVKFVTENYFAQMKEWNTKLVNTQNRITELYKVYDKVENVLKSAIPGEDEMKKYTKLSFKYQDLSVRLELAKTQVNKEDKSFKKAFDLAVDGLAVIINIFVEAKDLFIRQSLMTAVFNVVNSIYDLVDEKNKAIELSQIKFVTNKIAEYSILGASFNKDLLTIRHVGNNGIRDLAIMMGRPFNYEGLMEIVKSIELEIEQLMRLYDILNKNLQEQIQLLVDILTV